MSTQQLSWTSSPALYGLTLLMGMLPKKKKSDDKDGLFAAPGCAFLGLPRVQAVQGRCASSGD